MKFNKIFLLAGIVSLGLLTSCNDDDDYEKGAPASGQAANFGELSQSETMQVKETTLTFDVFRQDTSSEVDIPLEVVQNDALENGEKVFNIPASIHFNAGEDKTSLEVSYPNALIGEYYTFEVKIPEQYANPYKVNSFTRTIQRDYNWVQYDGFFQDGWLGGKGEVTIEHAVGFNKWRILEPLKWDYYDDETEAFYWSPKNVANAIEFTVDDDGTVNWTSFKYGVYDPEGYIVGEMEDGFYQIYAFRPSELDDSLAEDDAYTLIDDEDPTVLRFVPYMYVPALNGGFGEKALFYVLTDDADVTWLTK